MAKLGPINRGQKCPVVEQGQMVPCGRDALARGLCSKHYQRWKNHGDPSVSLKPRRLAVSGERTCSVTGCGQPHKGRGLCGMHLQRLRRTGSTDPPEKRVYALLTESELSRRAAAAGYEYVPGTYLGFKQPMKLRHQKCGDLVSTSAELLKPGRRVTGCSCGDIERTHKLYELGYYLVESWSDERWVRTDVALHIACGHVVTSLEGNLTSGHMSGEHPCNPTWVDPGHAAQTYANAGGTPSGPYPGRESEPWKGTCNTCGSGVEPTWVSLRAGNQVCKPCSYEKARLRLSTPPEALLAIMAANNVGVAREGAMPQNIRARNTYGVCLTCGDPVRTQLNNLQLGHRESCTCTARQHGFLSSLPGHGYLLGRRRNGRDERKYGIFNSESARLFSHEKNGWETLNVTEAMPGGYVAEMEREIHVALGQASVRGVGIVGKFDGYTETYLAENLLLPEETFHSLHSIATRLPKLE